MFRSAAIGLLNGWSCEVGQWIWNSMGGWIVLSSCWTNEEANAEYIQIKSTSKLGNGLLVGIYLKSSPSTQELIIVNLGQNLTTHEIWDYHKKMKVFPKEGILLDHSKHVWSTCQCIFPWSHPMNIPSWWCMYETQCNLLLEIRKNILAFWAD